MYSRLEAQRGADDQKGPSPAEARLPSCPMTREMGTGRGSLVGLHKAKEILYPKSFSSAISSRKTLCETSTQATRGHEMAAEDATRGLKFKPKTGREKEKNSLGNYRQLYSVYSKSE